MQREHEKRIAQGNMSVLSGRRQQALEKVSRVAIRFIEECGDGIELDMAVKEWRAVDIEFDRARREYEDRGFGV